MRQTEEGEHDKSEREWAVKTKITDWIIIESILFSFSFNLFFDLCCFCSCFDLTLFANVREHEFANHMRDSIEDCDRGNREWLWSIFSSHWSMLTLFWFYLFGLFDLFQIYSHRTDWDVQASWLIRKWTNMSNQQLIGSLTLTRHSSLGALMSLRSNYVLDKNF